MASRKPTLEYIEELRARGTSFFATEQFRADLGLTPEGAKLALWRLRRKRRVATPLAGFQLILPPEHRELGCLPPEEFIDALMGYLGEPYYVALLSAAELHGAAHHRPQTMQVIVGARRRSIRCGRVRIDFIVRKNIQAIPYVSKTTRTGYMRVSTPEATVFDLVGYMQRAVGLQNVVTVLTELASGLVDEQLHRVAQLSPVAWAQRVGWLLEQVGSERTYPLLHSHVALKARKHVPLIPRRPAVGAMRDSRWHVLVNESIDVDEV